MEKKTRRKQSTPNFRENEHFLPPDMLTYGKFGVLCFLEEPVLRLALLAYYRLNVLTDEVHSLNEIWTLTIDEIEVTV